MKEEDFVEIAYSEQILVGISLRDHWFWCVDDIQEFCFEGLSAQELHGLVPQFMDCAVSVTQLQQTLNAVLSLTDDMADVIAYRPGLMIDFNHAEVLNHFYEPPSFELQVPVGWKGQFGCFKDRIPLEHVFWIHEESDVFADRALW